MAYMNNAKIVVDFKEGQKLLDQATAKDTAQEYAEAKQLYLQSKERFGNIVALPKIPPNFPAHLKSSCETYISQIDTRIKQIDDLYNPEQ